jgi:fibronectin type 3 domain-containing protein
MGSTTKSGIRTFLWCALLLAGTAAGSSAPQAAPGALLVVGNTTLGAGDAAVQTRLQGLGYTVTVKLDSASVSGDATGKAIVVVSSTVTSGNVAAKFKTVTVPVLNYESAVMDDMGMTDITSGTHYGTTATQTAVAISTASHPMAAGLTGSPTVVSSAQTFTWGVPNANGVKVATLSGDATRSVIFGYDTGATMFGLTAPARRTGFFLQDATASAWNVNGQALFDAAVRWTAGVPSTPATPTATPGNAQVSLSWTAVSGATSYNVKRSTTSGGPYTTVGSPTTNSFTNTSLTNGTAYFYVVSAVNAGGESANSGQVSATPTAGAPATPTGLVATPGNAQVSLTWTAVTGATSYNVKRSTTSGGPYTTVSSPTTNSYTNTGLTNGTTYFYVVSAVNGGGESANSTQVSAMPVSPPATPTGFTATPGNTQVSLGWTAVSGATSYNVKRATVSGGPYTTVSSPTTNSQTDTGLTNGTAYFYVVSAVNAGGESANSTQVSATPIASGAGALFVVGSTTLGAGDAAIQTRLVNLGFTVTVKQDSASVTGDATGKAVVVISSTVTSANVNTKFRTVTVPVIVWESALFDDMGMTGLTSGTDFGTTTGQTTLTISTASHPMAAGLTGTPTVVTAVHPFTWGVPNANGTKIATLAGDATKSVIFGYLLGAVMPGLTAPARRVGFFLGDTTAANFNTSGGNLFDAAVRWCTTTPPGAPTGVTAANTTGQVSLTWTTVSGATSYSVKRSTVSGGPYVDVATGVSSTSYGDSTVTNGTTYFYVVTASNAGGEGAVSSQVSGTPIAAPTGLSATPGNTQVVLNWAAVTGAASYNVKRSTTSGGPYSTVGSPATNTFTNTGLTNGTTYFYVVSAVNAGGQSGDSAQVSAIPVALPPAPTGLTAAPGNAQVVLNWTAVTGATSYNVKRSNTSGGPYTTINSPTTNTSTNTGLTNGTTYFYVVSAVNAIGEGANSSQVSATPVAPPAAPTGLTATPGNTQVVLNWTAVTGATSYNVKRSTTSGGPYTTINSPTTNTSTNTGLTNGTTYFYVVSAVNAGGESANSTQVSATPVALPAAPTGLAATPSSGQVVLTWNSVSGATSYNVKRSTTSGGPYSTISSPTTNSYTNTGLTNGTTYYYVVSAVNAVGEGPNSSQVSATPSGIPAAPANLVATPGNGQATLSWNASSGAATYTVKRASTSVGPYSSVGSGITVTTFGNSGLTNGATYYYVVTATNALGESPNSAVVSVVPKLPTVPPVPAGLVGTPGNGQAILSWSAAPSATSYTVKRSLTDGGPYTTVVSGVVPTTYTNPGLTNGTIYYFVVSAVNGVGEGEESAQVAVKPVAPPTAPTGLVATPTGTQAALSWTAPTGAETYSVKRSTTSGGPYSTIATGVPSTSFVNTGLTAGTTYYYVVSAVNPAGESPNSAQASALASSGTVLFIVGNLTLGAGDLAIRNRLQASGYEVSVKLSTSSVTADANGKILVIVSSTVNPGDVTTKFKTVTTPVINWENGLMDDFGLTSNVAGNFGTTATQTQVAIVDPTHPMAAGQSGTVTVVTASSSFTWGVPTAGAVKIANLAADATKSTIFGYEEGASMFGLTAPARRVGFFLGDTNASNLNTAGWALFDAAVQWATNRSLPASPAGLTATAGNQQIWLTWNAVTGAASYTVKRSTTSGGPYTTVVAGLTLPFFTQNGLTNGATYYYVVSASSSIGEGANSAQVSVVPALPGVAPAAPSTLTVARGNQSVTLSWSPVPGATYYSVKRSTTAGGPYVDIAVGVINAADVDSGLTNGTTYYYVVTASNGAGESPASLEKAATPVGPPPAPQLVTSSWPYGTAGGISWILLPEASSYTVKRADQQEGPFVPIATVYDSETGYTDTAVVRGQTYYYVVSATGPGGTSPDSAIDKSIIYPLPPVPNEVRATGGYNQVTITMNPTYFPVTIYYQVGRSTSPTGPFTGIGAISDPPWQLVDANLAGGVTYYYIVHPYNSQALEFGPDSPIVSATTIATPLPAAPTGLSAIPGYQRIDLSWNAVPFATYYSVKRSLTPGGPYTTIWSPSTTSYANTGLTNGTTYYYVVTAGNSAGQSPPSAEVTRTAGAPPVPTGLSGTPAHLGAKLTWNPSIGATSYTVRRASSSGGPYTAIAGTSSTSYTDPGPLNPSLVYFYVVSASGPGGTSLDSSEVGVQPGQVPSAPILDNPIAGNKQVSLSWSAGIGATSFIVKRQKFGTSTWVVVATGIVAFNYVDTSVENWTNYYWLVAGQNAVGEGFPSNILSSAATGDPSAPASFTGQVLTSSSIRWTWQEKPGVTGYQIHDENHNVMLSPPAGTGTVIEPNLPDNTPITRHVHAVYGQTSSSGSPQVTLNTIAHDPLAGDLIVSVVSSSRMDFVIASLPNGALGSSGVTLSKSVDGVNWTNYPSPNGKYAFTDAALKPDTDYRFRIQYRSIDNVLSALSTVQIVRTQVGPPAVPAPRGVVVLSPTSIEWRWVDVDGETGYQVRDEQGSLIGTTGADVNFYVENGLAENTYYRRAIHSAAGGVSSGPSTLQGGNTLIHKPTAAEFGVVAISDTAVDISLPPPPHSTSGSSGMAVEQSSDGTNFFLVVTLTGEYIYHRTGLTPMTNYYFRARYVNAVGAPSENSPGTLVKTLIPMTGTAQSASVIRWSWTADPGATSYELHNDAHGVIGSPLPSGTLTVDESGLGENTLTRRHVHPKDAGGYRVPTTTVGRYTLARVATLNDFSSVEQPFYSFSRWVRITTVLPPNPRTVWPQENWRVENLQSNGTWAVKGVGIGLNTVYDDLSPTIVNGIASYRVFYFNGDGIASAPSPARAVTMAPDVPPGANNLRTTGITVNSISWAWDDVVGETSYELRMTATDNGWSFRDPILVVVPADTVAYTETGLIENQYCARVVLSATGLGHGIGSNNQLAKYTLVHEPTVADILARVTSQGWVDVQITPPLNRAAGTTGCEIQRSTAGGSWTTIKPFSNVYSYLDTQIGANKEYLYRVRFRNGDSLVTATWSPPYSVTTSAPPAPTGFGGAGSVPFGVVWSWIPVSGASEVELHTTAHVKVGSAVDQSSIMETGLGENMPVLRHAHSKNGLAMSAPTADVTAYTGVRAPASADLVVAAASATQVDLLISPPANNPAVGQTGCEILRSTNGGPWIIIRPFAAVYTFSDTGLTAGNSYNYRVRYRNVDGHPTVFSPGSLVSPTSVPPPLITTKAKKTRNQRTLITGSAAPTATVKVYFNGILDGTATNSGGSWSYTASTKGEGTYLVTATATVGATTSPPSAGVLVKVDLTGPAAPKNVRSTAYNNTVDVEWEASTATDVAGYRVERKTGTGGTWSLLNTTGLILNTKYRDSSALNGQTYYYRVIAYDDSVQD